MSIVDVTTGPFSVEITVTTDIDAGAQRTWEILTDTGAYPQWNPFLRRLDGRLEVGSRLLVEFQPDEHAAPRTMKPRVTAVEPGRGFAWLGRIGIPGLLDGRHRFTVEPVGDGASRLVQHERLAGALVPVFRRLLAVDTPQAFVRMNDALAARAAHLAASAQDGR